MTSLYLRVREVRPLRSLSSVFTFENNINKTTTSTKLLVVQRNRWLKVDLLFAGEINYDAIRCVFPLTFMSPITTWKSPPSALHSFSITVSIFGSSSSGQSRLGEPLWLRRHVGPGKNTNCKTKKKEENKTSKNKERTKNSEESDARAEETQDVSFLSDIDEQLWDNSGVQSYFNHKKLRGWKRILNPPTSSVHVEPLTAMIAEREKRFELQPDGHESCVRTGNVIP